MMNETTIRTWGGRDVRVGQPEGEFSVYATVEWPYGEGKSRSSALFAKPEAIRFAKALLDAVGQPFLMPGDGITIRTASEAGHTDRPATLGDVDRILAAIREGDETPPPMDSTEVWLDPSIDPRPSNLWGVLAWRAAHKKARVEIDSLRLSIAKRDRDDEAIQMHRTAEYRRMQDRMAEWERRATDAITERDQARQQRDTYKRELDIIEREAQRESDRLIDPKPTTVLILPDGSFTFPRGQWVLKAVMLHLHGGLSLDLEPYRG